MNIKEKMYECGCPNPFTMAETIAEERIDWTKEKDETEKLAECFGITKEGYMSDESPLLSPYIGVDKKGEICTLSEEAAEKRLNAFLKKYERKDDADNADEENKTNIVSSKRTAKRTVRKKDRNISIAQRHKRTVDLLILKKKYSSSLEADEHKTDNNAETPAAEDVPYIPEGMEWKDKGYFFNETVLCTDVVQRNIGDCYFLAALCSVAYVYPFFIKNQCGLRHKYNIGDETYAPWHLIEYYVPNDDNCEATKVWSDKKKTVQAIAVSEEVLVNKNTGYNYGACGPKELHGNIPDDKSERDACWPAVYEKAFAKFLERSTTDYPFMGKTDNKSAHIIGGWGDDALKSILHTDEVKMVSTDNLSVDEIWNIGMNARSYPTTATIATTKIDSNEVRYSKAGTSSYYQNTLGLYLNHVYSFLDVYSDGDTKYVVLRNPHGKNLAAMKNNPKIYQKYWRFNYGSNPNFKFTSRWDVFRSLSGSGDTQNSNGLFLIEINEFKRVFTSVEYYYGKDFSGTIY